MGFLDAEEAAILKMAGVKDEPFSPEVLACLPDDSFKITQQDLAQRRDLRGLRIVSIDPLSAKDLDDALSFERLDNDRVRVGVHIADVTHFVTPETALDKEAEARGTSVYLVQRVIPMLPGRLCEDLCSLNAGVERFAFSMLFTMDMTGAVHDFWAGKSVIKSSAKLAYEHAQAMIDGRFDPTECMDINGN
jgi:DIS3-like exonuclease 2